MCVCVCVYVCGWVYVCVFPLIFFIVTIYKGKKLSRYKNVVKMLTIGSSIKKKKNSTANLQILLHLHCMKMNKVIRDTFLPSVG